MHQQGSAGAPALLPDRTGKTPLRRKGLVYPQRQIRFIKKVSHLFPFIASSHITEVSLITRRVFRAEVIQNYMWQMAGVAVTSRRCEFARERRPCHGLMLCGATG